MHELLDLAGIDPTVAAMRMEAAVCVECRGFSYHGRHAIFEVMDVNSPRLRRLIQGGASPEALQAPAVEEAMTTLSDGALRLVQAGEMSIEEALRVVWLD